MNRQFQLVNRPDLHPNIPDLMKVRVLMEEIRQELYTAEPARLKMLMKKALPEYQPYLT